MLIKLTVFTVFIFGEVCVAEYTLNNVYDKVSFLFICRYTVGLIKQLNKKTKLEQSKANLMFIGQPRIYTGSLLIQQI